MMRLAGILAAVLCVPVAAVAQDSPSLRPHHVALQPSLTWPGTYDVGVGTAQLRGNTPGTSPPPFRLFTSDSHINTPTTPELKIVFALTRTLAIEGSGSFVNPRVGVAISNDVEAPNQELLGEELEQYLFEGGLSWQLPIRFSDRLAPFVAAGGGYLRQLHEDRTLAETGQTYYAGGGARYWLKGHDGVSKSIGIRGDFRINVRRNGIDFENKNRTFPSFSLGIFLGL